MLAARFNDVDVIEFLLKKGASLEIHDKYGYFPIHYAAIGGKTRNIRCLKDAGADISKETNRFYACDEIKPLCLAAEYGHIEAIDFLLKHGADLNERTLAQGETPLHLAARNGHLEIIHLLLRKGGNLNSGDRNGYLPLHYAAKMEHTDVVKFILQNGGSVTAKTHCGRTVLHFATSLDLVSFLVENGADVNARAKYGGTPLMAAAEKGQTDTVTFLLNQGANINAREKECGFSALYDALRNDHVATAKVLIEKGIELKITNDVYAKSFNPWLMSEAASKGLTDVLELLLQTGLSVDTQDSNGETALLAAARSGQCAAVRLLLDRGANVNGGDAGSDWPYDSDRLKKICPLYCALQCGHVEVAKLLLDRGADTSTFNSNNGNNFLTDLATKHGLSDIVELLTGKDTAVFTKAW